MRRDGDIPMEMKFKSDEQREEAQWIAYCACNAMVLCYSAIDKKIIDFELLKIYSKDIEWIEKVGMGNPSTLLMVFYSMIVMPKDIFTANIKNDISIINKKFAQKAQSGTKSDYKNESTYNDIDYFRHIRNAVSHGRVEGIGKDRVTFTDKNDKHTCTMIFCWDDLGSLCNELLELPKAYFDMIRKQNIP